MSQLGMMVISIGLSSYNIALFHLINHAFYKALLFLGAGSVIHAVADNQDFRKYGGLINHLPLTYSVMLIASLSLVAFPFMTGFYSKDFILESAYGQFTFSGVAVYIIATIGAIFTTLYSVKVLYLTFLTNPNGPRIYYKLAHEGDLFLILPLVILAIFSIFFGFITKDIFIGLGSDFFVDNSLFIHPIHEIMIDTEFAVPRIIKLIPFIFTVSFIIIAFNISELLPKLVINFKLKRLGYNIYGFFNQRALYEYLCITILVQKILYIGKKFIIYIDQGFLEPLGFIGKLIYKLSLDIAKFSTKSLIFYSLSFLASFVMYMFTLSFTTYPLVVMDFPANLVALNLIFALMVVFVIKNNYVFESLSKQKAILNSRCFPTREGNSIIEFNSNSLSYQGQSFNNLLPSEDQLFNNYLLNNNEPKKFLLDSSVEIVNKEIKTSNLIESTFSNISLKPTSNLFESISSSIELSSLN
jgi:NADH-ubiquinone oxidoreductase chain 5